MSEHAEQAALIHWHVVAQAHLPELSMLFAVPNQGQRSKGQRWKLLKEGMKAGVLDLWLPVPRGGYAGLAIEMKYQHPKGRKGRTTDEQRWWIEMLRRQAWRVEVCYGFEEARDLLESYLSEDPTTLMHATRRVELPTIGFDDAF